LFLEKCKRPQCIKQFRPFLSILIFTGQQWLSTHDAGDVVTNKDKALATGIDGLLQ
jgi:hypothetical protein